MALTLAKEEEIIKSWDVAKADRGAEINSSLIITNKRVVYQNETSVGLDRNEIATKDICGVSISHGKKTNSKAPIIFCAILAMLAGLMCLFIEDAPNALGIIFLIVGLLVLFIKPKTQFAFKLAIYTKALSSQLIDVQAGLNPLALAQSKKITTATLPVILIVKESVIKEIADTLGALILDNK